MKARQDPNLAGLDSKQRGTKILQDDNKMLEVECQRWKLTFTKFLAKTKARQNPNLVGLDSEQRGTKTLQDNDEMLEVKSQTWKLTFTIFLAKTNLQEKYQPCWVALWAERDEDPVRQRQNFRAREPERKAYLHNISGQDKDKTRSQPCWIGLRAERDEDPARWQQNVRGWVQRWKLTFTKFLAKMKARQNPNLVGLDSEQKGTKTLQDNDEVLEVESQTWKLTFTKFLTKVSTAKMQKLGGKMKTWPSGLIGLPKHECWALADQPVILEHSVQPQEYKKKTRFCYLVISSGVISSGEQSNGNNHR